MKTLLVTGGAGFIGSCFVRQTLTATAVRVVNLDKLTYAGHLDTLAAVGKHPRHVFVQGDMGDRGLVCRLLDTYQVDAVVNLAAETHVDRSIDDPRRFLATNVVGLFELLSAVRDYWEQLSAPRREAFRFLNVSTDEVYGSLGETGRFSETTPFAPRSPYAASKAAGDHFARAFGCTYGLPLLTTHCSNNYGPYQFPEKLIPLMTLNALEGKPLPVYGDGLHVRDWLHVEDHCRALALVLERGRVGETYDIGGGGERTNLEVVAAVCAAVDRLRPDLPHRPCAALVRHAADRPGHDRRYAIDAGKIRRELGWTPEVEFDRGIEQTVAWYLSNLEWVERVTAGVYRRQRLGLAGRGESTAPQRTESAPQEFREGPIEGVRFEPLRRHSDRRGWLVELFREDEAPWEQRPAMAYVSQTEPGVARGPHEHRDQTDCFAFLGPGDFRLWMWDARPDSPTSGNRLTRVVGRSDPQRVIIPPGVVHAYKNISQEPGWVLNAPNRLYAGWGRGQPVDEIRHEDDADSPYRIDDEPK